MQDLQALMGQDLPERTVQDPQVRMGQDPPEQAAQDPQEQMEQDPEKARPEEHPSTTEKLPVMRQPRVAHREDLPRERRTGILPWGKTEEPLIPNREMQRREKCPGSPKTS